jgi:hypothetical protein
MILCTHAIVGAAFGSFVPSHPGLAFVLGFCSHFVLDAIPHWDYPIRSASLSPRRSSSMRVDRAFVADLLTIGTDGVSGLAAAVVLFGPQSGVLAAAIAAMLPDPLQLLHAHFGHEPLGTLQRFHRWIHSKRKIAVVPFGALSQLALLASVYGLTKLGHQLLPYIAAK